MSTASHPRFRPILITAFALIAVFFGLFGCWATFAPLAKGVHAGGTISPDGSRRTVQHLEGGIIHTLHVREGSLVTAGDALITLEDTKARAMYDAALSRQWAQLAEQARLLAELGQGKSMVLDRRLTDTANPAARQSLADQKLLFRSRLAALQTQRDILRQTIRQLERQIEGYQQENNSIDDQRRFIELEIDDVEQLLDKGLARRSRFYSLKREQARLGGTHAANLGRIAQSREAISTYEMDLVRLNTERREEAATRLAELRAEIIETEETLITLADILDRTVIRAPITGTVLNLSAKTIGGVVLAGEPVLDIVPARETLVVEALVSPHDIDAVSQGLAAEVILTAYSRRTTPALAGRVEQVSADALTNETTGDRHYTARIHVTPEALISLPEDVKLRPGMPTDVMILAGERTLLDYLLEPLLRSFDRSFTEG